MCRCRFDSTWTSRARRCWVTASRTWQTDRWPRSISWATSIRSLRSWRRTSSGTARCRGSARTASTCTYIVGRLHTGRSVPGKLSSPADIWWCPAVVIGSMSTINANGSHIRRAVLTLHVHSTTKSGAIRRGIKTLGSP